MKNFEKFKTVEERTAACSNFLVKHNEYADIPYIEAAMRWLELEAEKEEPLPCPFCGDECACGDGYVECLNDNCCYSSGNRKMGDAVAIAAHNRVARAVMKEKEERMAK